MFGVQFRRTRSPPAGHVPGDTLKRQIQNDAKSEAVASDLCSTGFVVFSFRSELCKCYRSFFAAALLCHSFQLLPRLFQNVGLV